MVHAVLNFCSPARSPNHSWLSTPWSLSSVLRLILGLMWNIAETFNGLMAIPNLIALFLLSGTVVKLTKAYFAQENP